MPTLREVDIKGIHDRLLDSHSIRSTPSFRPLELHNHTSEPCPDNNSQFTPEHIEDSEETVRAHGLLQLGLPRPAIRQC